MNEKKIKLSWVEFVCLMNVLNEVCYGIRINNFENSIGANEQTVIDFMNQIDVKEEQKEIVLIFNDVEQTILKKSFDEVFKQIDEWEFRIRTGASKSDAIKIKSMICN